MPNEKQQSLRALDALNFCNAGIQTGLGPFMAIYYTAVRHWHPGQIGILIACQSLSGIAVQSAAGHLVDESHQKRLLTAIAGVTVALGALGIVMLPSFEMQIVVQLVIGLAVTIFPAATAAFALGLAGHEEFPSRVARNEIFTHSGNVAFALAAGVMGTFLAIQGIFVEAATFAAGMLPAVLFINESHVDYEAARGGVASSEDGNQPARSGWQQLLSDGRVLIFAACVVLYFCANAATLPLVSEILTQANKGKASAWQVAASVVVAEASMILVAGICGRLAESGGANRCSLLALPRLLCAMS